MARHHRLRAIVAAIATMTTIYLSDGKPVLRDGKVGIGSNCCCCCCNSITLNDLLYGNKEYSWPTIEPASDSGPQFGAGGATQPPVPPEYTAAGTTWVAVGGNCYEQTTVLDPQPANATAGKLGCGLRLEHSNGQWVEIAKHCFNNWKPARACLRWVCRCVDASGVVTCEIVHGGPTETNKSLPDLVTEAMGPEPEEGCYVYTVQFYGWKRHNCGSKQNIKFVPGDEMYSVYRTKVTSCP